jgi:hypothetical protein
MKIGPGAVNWEWRGQPFVFDAIAAPSAQFDAGTDSEALIATPNDNDLISTLGDNAGVFWPDDEQSITSVASNNSHTAIAHNQFTPNKRGQHDVRHK